MANSLSSQKCASCAGLPPLAADEIRGFMKDPEIEGWMLASDGTPRINKTFMFESADKKGWNEAWGKSSEFVKKILDLMAEESHHASYTHVPARRGGGVNVILVTHEVKGLSINDFRMAAKLNKLYERLNV